MRGSRFSVCRDRPLPEISERHRNDAVVPDAHGLRPCWLGPDRSAWREIYDQKTPSRARRRLRPEHSFRAPLTRQQDIHERRRGDPRSWDLRKRPRLSRGGASQLQRNRRQIPQECFRLAQTWRTRTTVQ